MPPKPSLYVVFLLAAGLIITEAARQKDILITRTGDKPAAPASPPANMTSGQAVILPGLDDAGVQLIKTTCSHLISNVQATPCLQRTYTAAMDAGQALWSEITTRVRPRPPENIPGGPPVQTVLRLPDNKTWEARCLDKPAPQFTGRNDMDYILRTPSWCLSMATAIAEESGVSFDARKTGWLQKHMSVLSRLDLR